MLLFRVIRHQPLTHPIALSYRLRSSIIRKRFLSISRTVAINMETVSTTQRLNRLRDLMKENKIDVYSMTDGVTIRFALLLMRFKSYHPRTAINPSILLHAMLVEV